MAAPQPERHLEDEDDEMIDEGLKEDEEDDFEDDVARTKSGRRGPDLEWEDFAEFDDMESFKASDIPAMLKKGLSVRSGKLSSVETYYCKFMRKRGYSCKVRMKVIFSESSEEITVQKVGGDHLHEINEDLQSEGGNDKYLKCTEKQCQVGMTGVMNETTPTVIRRNLKALCPEGKLIGFKSIQV